MIIRVRGYSDDLIEVEGDLVQEFVSNGDGPTCLRFSDGTVLAVVYEDPGLWRIKQVEEGSCAVSIEKATDPDSDEYSDVATLIGHVESVAAEAKGAN